MKRWAIDWWETAGKSAARSLGQMDATIWRYVARLYKNQATLVKPALQRSLLLLELVSLLLASYVLISIANALFAVQLFYCQ